MKVAVTGAGGLVGRAITAHCAAQGDQVRPFDHRKLDISDAASLKRELDDFKPEVVINCAAWTDVDGCESDHDRADRANALGPELLALACRELDALLITISTDYIFDGRKEGFYTQRDHPNPISVYGQSKLNGERRASAANARVIIVRSGYLFGSGGTNFLSTFFELAKSGQRLKVISDMIGTPTYAPDLAIRLRELAAIDLPGIYHVVNAGEGATFETFVRSALAVADLESVPVESTTLDELNRPAPRPRNSRMRCLLSEAINLPPLRDWQAALKDFVSSQMATDKGPTIAASPSR